MGVCVHVCTYIHEGGGNGRISKLLKGLNGTTAHVMTTAPPVLLRVKFQAVPFIVN